MIHLDFPWCLYHSLHSSINITFDKIITYSLLSGMFVLMSVVVNVKLSLMSVMSPPPGLCNLSVRTAVKLCIFRVLALGVSLVP